MDTPEIGRYCSACKLDENRYFFHGGKINDIVRNETYLINIKDKTYKVLKSGQKRSFCGSALKDNKVYIFGGGSEDSNLTTSCAIFDLKVNEWKFITVLPQASSGTVAAIVGKDIILSGYHLNCCYSYDDSTFSNILNLPEKVYKIVCDGWIYTNSILYENQDQIASNWNSYPVNPWNYSLWTYCNFKKNQFIYFIDSSNCLMRIDTRLKKVERIIFTY